jgi:hypothetical protein
MTPYEMARDLAVYRLNTFRLMRRHALHPFTGSWRKPVVTVNRCDAGDGSCNHRSITDCVRSRVWAGGPDDRYVPEWVRRGVAKDFTGKAVSR